MFNPITPPMPNQKELVNSIVGPHQQKVFINVGNHDPATVFIKNLSATLPAEYAMEGSNTDPAKPIDGWSLYGMLTPGETIVLHVNWLSAKLSNKSLNNSSFVVYGPGITPEQ